MEQEQDLAGDSESTDLVIPRNGPEINSSGNVVEMHLVWVELENLPDLPATLEKLDVSCNRLRVIAALPEGLLEFSCNYNQIFRICALPPRLRFASMSRNNLVELPAIPGTLKELYAGHNWINTLANVEFPDGILAIDLSLNQLRTVPRFPDSVMFLNLDSNFIREIDQFPASLTSLYIAHNHLVEIPEVPESTIAFFTYGNSLVNIPDIRGALNIERMDVSFIGNSLMTPAMYTRVRDYYLLLLQLLRDLTRSFRIPRDLVVILLRDFVGGADFRAKFVWTSEDHEFFSRIQDMT